MGSSCCKSKASNGPLVFSPFHSHGIIISQDKKQVTWKSRSEVIGSCFSNRPIKTSETVTVQFYGTGYVDVGLTDTDPTESDSPVFYYLCGRVLYFDPCVIKFYITNTGVVVVFENEIEKERVVVSNTEHWLMIKLGCGDIKVSLNRHNLKHSDTDV